MKELELSDLVESLRHRLRDVNLSSSDREATMQRRIQELQLALQTCNTEIKQLKQALMIAQAKSTKQCVTMATSTHLEEIPCASDKVTLDNLDNLPASTCPSNSDVYNSGSLNSECMARNRVRPTPAGSEAPSSLDKRKNETSQSDSQKHSIDSFQKCQPPFCRGPQKPSRKYSNPLTNNGGKYNGV